jgi:hypothetical protein
MQKSNELFSNIFGDTREFSGSFGLLTVVKKRKSTGHFEDYLQEEMIDWIEVFMVDYSKGLFRVNSSFDI